MTYDLMLIGPATRDVNIDYTGQEVHEIGGAVYFCAYAAKAGGANVYASVKINAEDRDILDAFEFDADHIALLPSPHTTLMRNTYFTADRERRRAECLAQSAPITPDQIPDVDCGLYHLAGLLYGDFPNELIEALSKKGKVSADIQGFLRHNESGTMNFHDWAYKKDYLHYFDFLKTDAAEAEILTGTDDRRAAAKMLYDWGAKEILISHNSEMLVFDGETYYTCPVKARNLSGRTGRGDTTFGAYLAKRMTGADIGEALEFATAAVSLKMETPGPLRGGEADVQAYINEFYH
ncbi:PfkB family carbohydrate kinase [Butyricicoccus sp. Marseille-Q5471]|uniref:PfkB family carbohydrate kinase n=1 Tax=Butyricicoccus sp. Marseille-Q5471 TaxID=3039493 RepID=UPI0024BC5C45|nr:PfkB family carbohydrate kinase [Butyricicoccus sp. Marseille-Q5471]